MSRGLVVAPGRVVVGSDDARGDEPADVVVVVVVVDPGAVFVPRFVPLPHAVSTSIATPNALTAVRRVIGPDRTARKVKTR
jgi:hypothetical protein